MTTAATSAAPPDGARAVTAFAGIAHFFNHLVEPAFYVVALVLPTVFGMPYEAVLPLILGGKVLTGLAAPLAGWLADRWGTLTLMGIYFFGMGLAIIATGLSQTPWQMAAALAAWGLFAAIYHPVGIAWVISASARQGKALGVNGVFGSLGPALGAVMAGALIDGFGWRAAFMVPGLALLVTGVLFTQAARAGRIPAGEGRRRDGAAAADGTAPDGWQRAFVLLALSMVCGGLIYQSTQAALPKLFEERAVGDALSGGLLGDGAFGPGLAVMLVYGFAAVMQVACGVLADRYPLKWVYLGTLMLQAPLLALATLASGLPLLGAVMLMVMLNTGSFPAENALIARFTPSRWRGTVFGGKYLLSFGISSLGVPMVALLRGWTGDFTLLLSLLAGAAAFAGLILLLLPDPPEKA
ncbi:MFS transporter [Novispirillum itersonii]|uniref:MFS transporter n=1 Tax=Novispirillum itersonii TaxID=189 RepID=UPI0003777329|nr:MFS transporter [Novispirillum itersonii]